MTSTTKSAARVASSSKLIAERKRGPNGRLLPREPAPPADPDPGPAPAPPAKLPPADPDPGPRGDAPAPTPFHGRLLARHRRISR